MSKQNTQCPATDLRIGRASGSFQLAHGIGACVGERRGGPLSGGKVAAAQLCDELRDIFIGVASRDNCRRRRENREECNEYAMSLQSIHAAKLSSGRRKDQ